MKIHRIVSLKSIKMEEIKHIPFQYDTCKCRECIASRERTKLRKPREHIEKCNPIKNWKNIASGFGDT